MSYIAVDQAQLVAEAFLDAPPNPVHPGVRAAYASLSTQVDTWFDRLTGPRAPHPVRVVYTARHEPYPSAVELAEQVCRHRVLEVSPAQTDRDRRHPVLDMSVGGTYDRLRAVHDIISHAWCGFGFDRDGEYSGWLFEDRLYSGPARWALATELHAEHSVRWTTGRLADHKATLLDPRILDASRHPNEETTHRRCPLDAA